MNNTRANPSGVERRSDGDRASFIPQTIEYSIIEAQKATQRALCDDKTYLRVELPMGRSRKHWYRMSPMEAWYEESSILVFHYASMFKSLRIVLVLGSGPGVTHPVPWIEHVCRLEDITRDTIEGADVVIIGAVSSEQKHYISKVIQEIPDAKAYILFNCALDTPLDEEIGAFEHAYACRAMNKGALLKQFHDEMWHCFVEIAVFEYEWVGEDYLKPSQTCLERFVTMRGAKRKGYVGYYFTDYAGCEGGFWPFMTAACREVLPMDGSILKRLREEKLEKKARNNSRPFGFF